MESFASENGIRIRRGGSLSQIGRGRIAGQSVLLALPQTYMNASGEAVAALCQKYDIEPSALCVVFDDIDLPLGALRMRARGSAGGQKGVASIIAALGTQGFPRLRVGVRGELYSRERDLGDYVLDRFRKEERPEFEGTIDRAVEALGIWLTEGIDAAMRYANQRVSSPGSASDPD